MLGFKMTPALAVRISALVGFFGVALGAFGAHMLKPLLEAHTATETWKTAVLYHLIHAVILVILANRSPVPLTAWTLFLVGIFLFSGSLYGLAILQWRWLGPVTPLGGLLLLAGWMMLALKAA